MRIDPPASLDRILSRLESMGKSIRPVRRDHLHVTLKFFGNVEQSAVAALCRSLDEVISAREAFNWSLFGTGAFPSPARPSVVWAGAVDQDGFADLAAEIESRGEALGFVREGRPFHAHVTLARIKFRPPDELAALLRETAEIDFGPQRAKEVVLFQSTLGRSGSTYTPLHVAKLTGQVRRAQ